MFELCLRLFLLVVVVLLGWCAVVCCVVAAFGGCMLLLFLWFLGRLVFAVQRVSLFLARGARGQAPGLLGALFLLLAEGVVRV